MPLLPAFLIFILLAVVLVAHHFKSTRTDPRTSPPAAVALLISAFIALNAAAALRSLQTGWVMAGGMEYYDPHGSLIPPPGKGALLLAQIVFMSGLLGAVHRILRMAPESDPSRPLGQLHLAWLAFRMLLEAVMAFALVMTALGGLLALGALGGGAWGAPWRLMKGLLCSWPVILFVILPALGRAAHLWFRKYQPAVPR